MCFFFFFKQKTAYEMRISDWSSDVCSSDLPPPDRTARPDHGVERSDRRRCRRAFQPRRAQGIRPSADLGDAGAQIRTRFALSPSTSSGEPCRRTVLLPKPRQRTSRTSTGSARPERTWRPYARKGNPPRPRLLWRDKPRRPQARHTQGDLEGARQPAAEGKRVYK